MATHQISCCARALVAVVCVLGLSGAAANADLPDVVLEISAEANGISKTVEIRSEWGSYDPVTHAWTYDMPADLILYSGTTILGYVGALHIELLEDPEVNLTFSVQAGTQPTTFHVASSLITFPTIGNPEGRASAGYTVTDFNGDGAALTGIGETGGGYLAKYNGWAGDFPPGGTTFSEELPSITAGMFGSNSDDFEDPVGGGFRDISGSVSSISSLAYFQLTPRDLASGTSNFQVTPEPSILALFAVGGLTLLRRRR